MANILFLVHRLPYPPNKGDKVRSYHLLKHLVARHQVFLGTFVDDPDDEVHLPKVRAMCAGMYATRLRPRWAKVRSLTGLLTGDALGLGYYRNNGMKAWVGALQAKTRIDATVVFSSTMAQYAPESGRDAAPPLLVDFVDLDSAKWVQYAERHGWPLSWVYAREGRLLLAYERALAARARRSFFVTQKETELFRLAAPECGDAVEAMGNGVDAEYFSPQPNRESPFPAEELPLVFTGAMDYWPNVDAVCWFVADVLPALRKAWPSLRFYVVGRSPSPEVQMLASNAVVVTGTVPDVRPYLQYAAVVVAPMRVARGVQNKILEAMAMARPVVAASGCVDAIDARRGDELLAAETAEEYQVAIRNLVEQPTRAAVVGAAGRQRVVRQYSWDAHLQTIDKYLPAARQPAGLPSVKRLATCP